jgi:hypothetical protein
MLTWFDDGRALKPATLGRDAELDSPPKRHRPKTISSPVKTSSSFARVELTRFRGHLRMCRGVHDGKAETISG